MRTATSRGFALIIVLWVGVLLCVIAASFALSMRAETRQARYLVDNAGAGAIAEAAIRRGTIALLAKAPDPRWVSDGRVYILPFGGGSMRIRVSSENGKIDLNSAPEELIEGLLSALVSTGALSSRHQAMRIAAAILDWRDPDQRMRADGAEDASYKAAGLSPGARDGPFLSVEELNLVRGIDADVYARLAPYVSVHSWVGQVDPATAPGVVLLAIPGLDGDSVEHFVSARNRWYAGRSGAVEGASRLPLELLAPGGPYLLRQPSHVYTVDAVGELPGGARASRRAVVRLTGRADRPFSILAWHEAIPQSEIDALVRVR
jgi:general secretion pathway protein K